MVKICEIIDSDIETENLLSINNVKQLVSHLVLVAQAMYNEWDEEDEDTYAGGGICHLIADGFVNFFWDHRPPIHASTVSSSHEQHVYTIIKVQEGVYSVDIHHSTYETGGGFSWRKIPNVTFEPGDIHFYKVSSNPDDFDSFTDS